MFTIKKCNIIIIIIYHMLLLPLSSLSHIIDITLNIPTWSINTISIYSTIILNNMILSLSYKYTLPISHLWIFLMLQHKTFSITTFTVSDVFLHSQWCIHDSFILYQFPALAFFFNHFWILIAFETFSLKISFNHFKLIDLQS